jgi:ABC-2 type transport system permease protein
MRATMAVVVRVFAFVGKELIETIRRPGAILSLILGPFLIMTVFGLGYSGVRRPLETVIVAPASSQLPRDVATYQDLAGPALHIVEVTEDRAAAEAGVRSGRFDMAIVTPDDPEGAFRAGQQSVLEVVVDEVDPVDENYASILSGMLANEINKRVVEGAVREGQGIAIDAGNPEAALIPPDVVAAPTRAEVRNVAPSEPRVISFFGPAVLALILQHLAVTLVALSLVRERTSGVMELFRISPVSPAEVLAGKIIAFGVLGAVVSFATVLLLRVGFGIPILGPPALIAATIALFVLASIGVGLLIAVIADSERQAVQLSLLVLLAAVFFSGFVLGIDEFTAPVRALAYLLPVTHGIVLLQDLMLRGATNAAWELGALGAIALVTLFVAWALMRRAMTSATA